MNDSRPAARQQQFLDGVSRDEAERRFRQHLRLAPVGTERVPLARALGRVLAGDVVSEHDVPGFDRANVDGFAVRAEDTHGAAEETPRAFSLTAETLAPGMQPREDVLPGMATPIATG